MSAENDPAPIKAPELDDTRYDHKAGNATISYFVPDSYFSGGQVTGALKWHALLDGEEYSTGDTNAGDVAEVKFEGLERGVHTFEFYVQQDKLKSATHKLSAFVGYDTPEATSEVTLTETAIYWEPVTRTLNKGYLDVENMVYRVYVNDEEVGSTKDTKLEYVLPQDAPYTSYEAKVVVDNGGILSDPKTSESLRVGKPWELDVRIAPTRAQAAVFSAFDVNGDEYVWSFGGVNEQGEGAFYDPTMNYYGDNDWLLTPPLNFDDPTALYEITYDVRTSADDENRLGVYLLDALDPRSQAAVIQETRTMGKGLDFETYSNTVAVSAPGTYYVGLFTDNKQYCRGLRVRNINIKKIVSDVELPAAVTSVSAKGAANGELKAVVEFNLPAKYISGNAIPADVEVTAIVTVGENKGEVTGKPGTHQSIEVPSVQGLNHIHIVTSIDGHNGQNSNLDVFTGVDKPGPVASLDGYVSEDNLSIHCRWTPPTESENGYYLDPADVTYLLMEYSDGGWQVIEDLGKNVFEYTYSVPAGTPLAITRFGIAPATAEGRSSTTMWLSDVLGEPFEIPFTEVFENAEPQYRPTRILRIDETYADSEWGVVNPSYISPTMANESGFALYGRSETPGTNGMIMLPKVNTIGKEDAGITLNFWTGEECADVTIYGESFDTNGLIELGKIPVSGEGWKDLSFKFPESMQNHKWAVVYVGAKFAQPNTYALISNYTMGVGVTGIGTIWDEGVTVTGQNGNIHVSGCEGMAVSVYGMDGTRKAYSAEAAESLDIAVPAGIYVVKAGNASVKILVK